MSLSVDGVWKAGVWATTVWADGVWREGAAPDPDPDPSPGLVEPSGGSGKRYRQRQYRTDTLDLETWRKRGKRLEARVEIIQKKIQIKRERIDYAPSIESVSVLKKQIAQLQETLLELLAEMDILRKQHNEGDEAEAMQVYLAYRTLH